jgi:hypothetical protein
VRQRRLTGSQLAAGEEEDGAIEQNSITRSPQDQDSCPSQDLGPDVSKVSQTCRSQPRERDEAIGPGCKPTSPPYPSRRCRGMQTLGSGPHQQSWRGGDPNRPRSITGRRTPNRLAGERAPEVSTGALNGNRNTSVCAPGLMGRNGVFASRRARRDSLAAINGGRFLLRAGPVILCSVDHRRTRNICRQVLVGVTSPVLTLCSRSTRNEQRNP